MARILVIDDAPDILLVIDLILRKAGHFVVTSSDPTKAVTLALEHHVDAVVLDVVMPLVSGFDALHALRSEPGTGGVPILFLSGRSESEDRVRGLKEGADDYMTKPFDAEELVLRVERLVGPHTRRSSGVASSELMETLRDRRVTGSLYLGRYQALEVVGEGAMGLVFRGWDPRLKRPVALKTLRLDRLADLKDRKERIARLLEEASTTARINHPNIVSIYDADADPEIAYMAMEYVEGTTLSRLLKKHGPLPPEQTIALALEISRGLAAAHERRIVHHDVKPGNVLLGYDGSVKVSDFGIADLVHALIGPSDKIFGTVGYLPPETLDGGGFGETGDLFALGSVLYECLTGERAFGGTNLTLRIYRTMCQEVEPPSARAPGIPHALDELVLELLQKDPAVRLASAREVVRRLQAMADRELRWDLGTGKPPDRRPSSAPDSDHLRSGLLTTQDVKLALERSGRG